MDLPFPIFVVVVALVIASITDLRHFRIYNWLTLPLAASGLIYHAFADDGRGIGFSVVGMLAGFSVFFLLFLVGGMGGGDVKLMAGIGAWVGATLALAIAAFASIAAGVYALVIILLSGRARETWMRLRLIFHRAAAVSRHLAAEDRVEEAVAAPDRRTRAIPFGAMIAVGVLVLLVLVRTRVMS